MGTKVFYTEQIQIPFHLADPAGMLFYGNYSHLSHHTIELGLQSLDISWDSWFKNPDWIVPIRALNCEYLAPVFAGKNYEIRLSIDRLGAHSICFLTEFFHGNLLCATTLSTHVFLNKKTFKKRPIPNAVHAKFQKLTQST